ncbi:hypothetical protein [Sinanaerobacter sp. ZZT-01]|uniref:hypothetical protein n=1 Tax=Sinanaerobacter sp. ZZT-01 TaxID=3111540 RepID=UPI002D79E5A3|nr:hypothetical protein [Sinanaerobacter sp. ZZT-01]WRR92732.1 hypothetical protein U5921_11845 [Sinanaerobacter sp. ZZT-01]
MKNTIMTMLGFIGVCVIVMLVVVGLSVELRFMDFVLQSIKGMEIGVIFASFTIAFIVGTVVSWVSEAREKANLR